MNASSALVSGASWENTAVLSIRLGLRKEIKACKANDANNGAVLSDTRPDVPPRSELNTPTRVEVASSQRIP